MLAPYSDLDVVMVHGGRRQPDEELLRRSVVPDVGRGLPAGSRGPAANRGRRQRTTTTSTRQPRLLSGRPIAGDVEVGDECCATAPCAAGASSATAWLRVLRARTIARHEATARSAFLLGARPQAGPRRAARHAATVGWLEAADLRFHAETGPRSTRPSDVLLDVRVALHRVDADAPRRSCGSTIRMPWLTPRGFGTAGAMMTQCRQRRPRPGLGARGAVGIPRSPVVGITWPPAAPAGVGHRVAPR